MKRYGIILLALSTLFSLHAEEKNLRGRFEWVQPIVGSFSEGDRGRVVVSADVFGQARNFPNDLRILGDGGAQWPFFLYVPQDRIETGAQVPKILNRSFVSGRDPYLQFDLVIPQEGTKKSVHNRVELITSGRDFIRRVEVLTEAGALMAVGHLIDFSGQRGARNRTIQYPVSDAARLHIRIFSNARNNDETFTLTSVKLRSRTVVEVDRETVEATEMPVPEREEEKGAQTHLFDLGAANRPVGFLVFAVDDSSFARSISVYGRNSDHESWSWIGGGEIHALGNDVQLEVALSRVRYRYLKLHVFHHDDQPLAIESIQLEAVPRYLIFEAASDGSAGLYFRAWDLKAPRYDLKGRIETKTLASLPIFRSMESVKNELANEQPWRKYSKGLGIIAVGAVSLLVLGIIASMLRQQKLGTRN